MRILIDTDVLLDVALDRTPHSEDASRLLRAVQRGAATAVVAWHTVSNLYYLLSAKADRRRALAFIRDLARIVEVAPADSDILKVAISLRMRDFEDAMQVAAALAGGADLIATRNVRDFRGAPIRAVAPRDLTI
ncbi:MAG TPA: PIN domain-containing protein [Thermoanaerobaculia bacterium]|nr:PIN domain-containing protein [Thermoanaerobaculia bacterium]